MNDFFIIRLNDLRFFSEIGVTDQERIVGNEFAIDIAIVNDASEFVSENLDTTVSYAEVYEIVENYMCVPRLLLETVCREIAERIIANWDSIAAVKVKVTKLYAPIIGIRGNCSVEYTEYSNKKKLGNNFVF